MVPTDYDVVQPWVRQPFDGDLEWALFQDFLTLAGRPRDVRALVRLGAPVSVPQLEAIAFEKGWNARADRWDEYLDQIRIQTIEDTIQETAREVAQRHGRVSRKAVILAEKELDKYLKAAREGDGLGLLTPRDIIRFLVLGVRTERLVIGEATDRVETEHDLSGLSLDELRTLREIQTKTKPA